MAAVDRHRARPAARNRRMANRAPVSGRHTVPGRAPWWCLLAGRHLRHEREPLGPDSQISRIKGEIEMATKHIEDSRCSVRRRSNRQASLSAYGVARSTVQGTPLSADELAQNPCLLARLQLPEPRHDLSARQSSAARASETGAHQEPASGTLGSEPGLVICLHSPEPVDQEIRPGYDLPCRTRARSTGRPGASLSGGHLFGDLHRQMRRHGRAARILQAILFPGRDWQPLYSRNSRVDS